MRRKMTVLSIPVLILLPTSLQAEMTLSPRADPRA